MDSEIMPRIRVVVPCANQHSVHPKTQESVDALLQTHGMFIEVLVSKGCAIASNRSVGGAVGNEVFQKGFPYDYYLALDSDIGFRPEQLLRLVQLDLNIVGAAYQFRANENAIVAGDWTLGGYRTDRRCFLTKETRGLQKVDWIGMGFTLIKSSVFRKIRFPWWREMVVEYFDEEKERLCAQNVGDDIGFCIQAREAGINIYVDCDNIVEHFVTEPKTERTEDARATETTGTETTGTETAT